MPATPGQLHPVTWYCTRCGEANETLVDPSAGLKQEYVEDCAVCCRPNVIFINIDAESLRLTLRNELEYE
ncbi:MAG: CPXCG motif-containing cysteine-rich protein [candidate division KSB1 bacterium]|nr:CPXCG motif-containing cysteine-rich protein [candidate division KSB1 bacterium]MDZ7275234.1 CPXCG motif-containing cysteine-rich protein [candidate division KSB1 bacterium]MDZ7287402.1 CPXCG motif-containing cysteine-rich protein [candidate division KSB1 bacterium]MDZ7299516.1 CPXCG motif-containing cysteine-rich protein [candidate division KSB1 bacterium]MDZ7305439.1 CPXCG motif-containing cysteine-rich protein [candidate division KSB1 bacterium]